MQPPHHTRLYPLVHGFGYNFEAVGIRVKKVYKFPWLDFIKFSYCLFLGYIV
jgi:hypothetical protein